MTASATTHTRPGATRLYQVSAGEAMHRGVLSVPLQTPLTKVAQMMSRYGMHCVVALDERGEYQARLWGLIPAAELVRIATSDELENRTAGASATLGVVTVGPADSVYDAARLMAENDLDHVIVVDPVSNRPVGVLSTLDVRPGAGHGRF
jgi:CBS domain-containing protein